MRVPRPSVLAHENFVKHKNELERLPLEQRFSCIGGNNVWRSPESNSGAGFSLDQPRTLVEEIPALLRRLGATSLLDMPCGDFHWLSQADLGVDYTGAHIVREQVRLNAERYGGPRRRFVHLNLTSSELPKASVVLCRDCLVHLSLGNIACALARLRDSGSDDLLMTHFPLTLEIADITDGGWRSLDFTLPPFTHPQPICSIVEHGAGDDGACSDEPLALCSVSSLA